MRRGALIVLLVALTSVIAPVGRAAPVLGDDEVSCVDGSVLRGTIVDVQPDREVHIEVLGEQRVIPWSEVASITRDKFAEASVEPPTPTPQTPHVTLTGSGSVRYELYRRTENIRGNTAMAGIVDEVCQEPCEVVVDNAMDTDWVVGGSVVWGRQARSEGFRLTPGASHVQIEARGGRTGVRLLGWALSGVGLVLTQVGLGLAISGDLNEEPRKTRAGVGLLAGSGVLYIGGLSTLLAGRLRVKVRSLR